MVAIKFYANNGRSISLGNDVTTLPDEVCKIQIDFFVYDFEVADREEEEDIDYRALTNLVRQTSRKIPYVNAEHIDDLTDDQAEFLKVVFASAEYLEFQRWTSNDAYSCLANGGLVPSNGLRRLECYSTQISTEQARLLFEGVAASPCLEHLCLRIISFDNHDECCQAMVAGLQLNRSLKKMEFRFIHFRNERMLRSLLMAAILETKIEELSIWSDEEFPVRIPWTVLGEVLGSEECALNKLDLQSARMMARPQSTIINDAQLVAYSQNTSVTDFSLSWHALQSTHLIEISSLFRALVTLQLEESKLTDLSDLDPLLIGKGLALEHLNLNNNVIGVENVVAFFGKLPQMTCIRSVQLADNPFLASDAWMGVLQECIWRNRSLESLVFFDEKDSKERVRFYSTINVPLSWNRGGRRALSIGSSSIPINLWPLVLKRATTLKYFDSKSDSRHEALLTSTRVDVVFWLLREEMMQQSLFES